MTGVCHCSDVRNSANGSLVARAAIVALLLLAMVACGGGDDDADADAKADPPSTSAPAAAEPFTGYDGYESQQYDGTTHWICHPDLEADQCGDLDTTVVQADGSTEVEEIEPAEDPPIDCFYAYPTASSDPAPSADFDVNESEIDTVRSQTAQFGSLCRVFAPAYRQVPLVAVTTRDEAARKLAYDDVLDAFKTYMTQENDGRGVVLIGHSQGAGILQRIMTAEMDGNPELRRLLVSALLLGTSVAVPEGADVGGQFKEIPACREAGQTGCVISFASFPADQPPSESGGSFFGRASGEGMQALCVNPAELAGGDGLADPILYNKATLLGSVGPNPAYDTPYVSMPGAMKAECVTSGALNYLAFAPAGAPGEVRDVAKPLVQGLGPTWGLHTMDANLPQGDLLAIVEQQSESFTS
jgi:hypothetical protein